MKTLVFSMVLFVTGGWCQQTQQPNLKVVDNSYGKPAVDSIVSLLGFLVDQRNNCGNNDRRKCFHNDWERRDAYCSGELWNQRYSFSPWYGGNCYCCARCYPKNEGDLCFWKDSEQRDKRCDEFGSYSDRYVLKGPEEEYCYCCPIKKQ